MALTSEFIDLIQSYASVVGMTVNNLLSNVPKAALIAELDAIEHDVAISGSTMYYKDWTITFAGGTFTATHATEADITSNRWAKLRPLLDDVSSGLWNITIKDGRANYRNRDGLVPTKIVVTDQDNDTVTVFTTT